MLLWLTFHLNFQLFSSYYTRCLYACKCSRFSDIYINKALFIRWHVVFDETRTLLPAYLGKQKKTTALFGINTVHLLYYRCKYNLGI